MKQLRINSLVRRSYHLLLQSRCSTDKPESLERTAIVFSPHQDDETLGCGGTIIKKVQSGAPLKIVFMTDGSQSHSHLISANDLRDIRSNEALAAAEKLGVASQDVVFLNITDGTLSQNHRVAVGKVKEILLSMLPEEVFIPYSQDGIPDHNATCHIVLSALRESGLRVTVYEYPVWFWCNWPWTTLGRNQEPSSNNLQRNWVTGVNWIKYFRYAVDIREVLELKHLALEQHRSQMTRLILDPRWQTLGDVAQGEFLQCFFQNHEFFYRYRLN